MSVYSNVDYLLVGHVCRDLTPEGAVPGGTVTYSGLVAQALGCETAVLTSTAPDMNLAEILPGIAVHNVPAAHTTTFENVYTSKGRQQTVHAVARTITAEDVPAAWRRAHIVHLGPIANEIDPTMIALFSNSLVGLTPQGWFRRWGEDGRVYGVEWPAARQVMPLAAAVILSLEDLPDPQMLDEIRQWARLLVLTEQSGGCTVFYRDETRQLSAPKVEEVNPTGAGDVFAASFLVRLHQTRGNPWEAAAFANLMAANSVTQNSMAAKLELISQMITSAA